MKLWPLARELDKSGHNKKSVKLLVALAKDLLALIHTCFQVDVVTALWLACVGIFHPVFYLQGIMCAAHIALGRCCFSLWYSHCLMSLYKFITKRNVLIPKIQGDSKKILHFS